MNKKTFASLALLGSILCSQAAFAGNEQIILQDQNQQLTQELTKENVLSSNEGYVLEQQVARPQARRSALFAKILDTMAKKATLAKNNNVIINING